MKEKENYILHRSEGDTLNELLSIMGHAKLIDLMSTANSHLVPVSMRREFQLLGGRLEIRWDYDPRLK